MKHRVNQGRVHVSTLLLSMTFAIAGCGGQTPATTQANELPAVEVTLAGKPFKLEIADDEPEREFGLMNRKTMPADHGMLFVFPDVKPREFWMKNTLLPLDIAFLDQNGTVLNVEQMYPQDLTGVPSAGPAQYAIELNQGVGKEIGLKPGDHIALPPTSGK